MVDYSLIFTRSARKDLEALEAHAVQRIFPKIESLAKEHRPSGCRKLQGQRNLWRIRIGNYRVVYGIYDNEQIVDIILIRHRKEAYKGFR